MSLTLIIGPMFSGKTTELIRRCKRFISVGMQVLICNAEKDNRNGMHKVSTHDGEILDAKSIGEVSIDWVKKNADNYNVIAFDEGQFFPNLPKVVSQLKKAGKSVLVSGLSGDSNLEPWETISKLIPLADDIVHTKAICVKCHADAAFSKKLVPNKKKIEVGAKNKYIAVCFKCYKI